MKLETTILLAILLAVPAQLGFAQTSASYKLTEHAFNAGGHPQDGTVLSSSSYRVRLDAIGDGVLGNALSSASFRMDGGFVGCYPPPGEVEGLRFADLETLVWDPDKSVGHYNLYRDDLDALDGLGFGACLTYDIDGESTTDADTPPAGDGYFYLVTAENRLAEEGTKGVWGGGATRANDAPCP